MKQQDYDAIETVRQGKKRKTVEPNKNHESKNCPKQCECLGCVWPNSVFGLFIGQFDGEISKSHSRWSIDTTFTVGIAYVRAFDQLLSPNDLNCIRIQLD